MITPSARQPPERGRSNLWIAAVLLRFLLVACSGGGTTPIATTGSAPTTVATTAPSASPVASTLPTGTSSMASAAPTAARGRSTNPTTSGREGPSTTTAARGSLTIFAAEAFIAYILSPAGQAILKKWGFIPIGPTAAPPDKDARHAVPQWRGRYREYEQ